MRNSLIQFDIELTLEKEVKTDVISARYDLPGTETTTDTKTVTFQNQLTLDNTTVTKALNILHTLDRHGSTRVAHHLAPLEDNWTIDTINRSKISVESHYLRYLYALTNNPNSLVQELLRLSSGNFPFNADNLINNILDSDDLPHNRNNLHASRKNGATDAIRTLNSFDWCDILDDEDWLQYYTDQLHENALNYKHKREANPDLYE